MISKKFFASSLAYTVSSALPTVASFLLLPYYTSTHLLSLSDFGALALYINISLLVQLVAGMSLDFYVSVAYHELKDKPEELRKKIAALNGYLIITGALIFLVFIVAGNLLMNLYVKNHDPNAFRYIIMSVVTGIFNSHYKFYNALLINKEKPGRHFASNILNFITTVLFSILILKQFPLTLEGPLWGRLLSGLFIFAWSFTDILRMYGIAFHTKFIKPVLKFSIPLLITALLQWVLVYSDRYIIKPLLHNEELAIFDLAVRFTVLISFALDGLSSAMAPRIFSLLKEEPSDKRNKEINKYYSSFNLITVLLIPANILLLPIILPVVISNDTYLQAFIYFGIVAASLLTRSLQNLFTYPVHFNKQTQKLIWVNLIAAILQIGIGYLMISQFNLYGAAITQSIIKAVQIILYLWFCGALLTPNINFKKMVALPILSLLVILAGEMMIGTYGLKMHLIHISELFVIILLSWLFYQYELLDLWSWVIKKYNSASPSK